MRMCCDYDSVCLVPTQQWQTPGYMLAPAPDATMRVFLRLQGIILCQYVPCTDPVTCASHGVPRFYYAQVAGRCLSMSAVSTLMRGFAAAMHSWSRAAICRFQV